MLSLIAQPQAEIITPIRVETLLSKQPVHRLSHHGNANIEIRDKESGKVIWQVSHNSKYGEPGPLAYKLETLVINRRIDEARCPDVPEVIRLGSMREIAELCAMGGNTNKVKSALLQNAGAFITALLSHTDREKTLRTAEINGTRYTLVFTGEHFPDGRKADAVYLILTSWYREIQNSVPTRPLDYDYLKILPPASQRLYELVSFQIYAALKHERPRARMLYSDFCMLAPQTRYFQYKRMHRQMNDVHAPHLKSSYLTEIEFREATDRDGNPDWEMFYTPGTKAKIDHNAAGKRIPRSLRRPRQLALPFAAPEPIIATLPTLPAPAPFAPEETNTVLDTKTLLLKEQLMAHGLGKAAAQQYAQAKPEECRRQLDCLPYVTEFKSSKGAYLRSAIEEGYGPPKGYEEAKKADAARRKREAAATATKARQRHEEAHQSAYNTFLTECLAGMETAAPEAYSAFCQWEEQDRLLWTRGPLAGKDFARQRLAAFDQPEERTGRFRRHLAEQAKDKNRVPGVPTFWEWDKDHNPEPFHG